MAKWNKNKPSNPWHSNMILFANTGQAGDCPYCGSTKLTAEIWYIGRGSLNFFCPDCGERGHIDGAPKPPTTEKEL